MTANQSLKRNHSDTLSGLISILVERYQPLQIFEFGYVHSERIISGCFSKENSLHEHQYFLFMVTESNAKIVHEVQDYVNKHYSSGIVTILCHGIENICDSIKKNSRFFITLMNKGKLLYSKDGIAFVRSVPDYNFEKSLSTAQKQLAKRIPLITGFLSSAQNSIKQSEPEIATFLLHQSVEQCSIMLIQLITGYRSELHSLRRQLELCNSFSTAPYGHFLTGGSEDKRLFDILSNSYSSTRYKEDFTVSISDAEALYVRVASFYKMAQLMCDEQLSALGSELDRYKDFQSNNPEDSWKS